MLMNNSISENNKRIVKNTLLLYVRMIILTLINLYVSRIVLQELGISDFGTYSVVGGIIIVFSFLSGPLASGCQRFITYELGRKDYLKLKSVFSSSVFVLLIVAIIVTILGETIGLWFLNNRMSFPEGRLYAANVVYQLSIATFIVNLLAVPYNATIIAHEQMSVFAYISIIEALGKLLIAYCIAISPIDNLIFYSISIFLLGVLIRFLYQYYCIKRYVETKVKWSLVSKTTVFSLLNFSGWVILGGLREVLHTQGISIIVNVFYGVTVNAAQGISNQVNNVVSMFVSNFLTAINPQLVKAYAEENNSLLCSLVFRGSRLSVFMVSLFVVPILLETPTILEIWLNDLPEYTIIFVRAVIIIALCESFATIIRTTVGATGNIKNYQICLVCIGILHLPLTWVAFSMGYLPYYSMIIYIFLAIVLQIIRIVFVCNILKIRQIIFYKEVIFPSLLFLVLSFILPFLIHYYSKPSFITSFLVCLFCVIEMPIIFYYIGCKNSERVKIKEFIFNKLYEHGYFTATKK